MTTPQGDLNTDGDVADNSFKMIPAIGGTVSVVHLSNAVTLSAAIASGYTSLKIRDGIIINGAKFIVSEVTDATHIKLDKVFDGPTDAAAIAYKFLGTQTKKSGEWESWFGDFDPAKDEGHVQMECSNRGLCDRKSGQCKCFPGYDGAACQRTVCPNDCSGHGVCDSVSELRLKEPVLLSATVQGSRFGTSLTTSADLTSPVKAGDVVLVGDIPTPFTVGSASATAVVLTSFLPRAVPAGSPVYLQAKYELWDARSNRACTCDSRFSGFDCSDRKCPTGDDPLTVDQYFETQIINIGGANPANKITGSFKLVFTDQYGEEWKTDAIPMNGNVDKSTEVKKALMDLPNDVVEDVSVESLAVGTKGVRYHVAFDAGSSSWSNGNPGDLPALGCDSSDLAVRLEGAALAGTPASRAFTFTGDVLPGALTAGDWLSGYTDADPNVYVDDFQIVDVTIVSDKITVVSVTKDLGTTVKIVKPLRTIKGGVDCTVSDRAQLMPATWAAAYIVLGANAATSDKTLTLSAAAHSLALSIGDRLLLVDGTKRKVLTVTDITNAGVTIATKEEVGDSFAAASTVVYFYGKGTKENTVCSGRGLCDGTSGLCKCFKGYTMDNCSRQNALAI